MVIIAYLYLLNHVIFMCLLPINGAGDAKYSEFSQRSFGGRDSAIIGMSATSCAPERRGRWRGLRSVRRLVSERDDAFLGRFRDGDCRAPCVRIQPRGQILRDARGPVVLAQSVVMFAQQTAARPARQAAAGG